MATMKYLLKIHAIGNYSRPYHKNGFYSLGNNANSYSGRICNKHKNKVYKWKIQSTCSLFHKVEFCLLREKA